MSDEFSESQAEWNTPQTTLAERLLGGVFHPNGLLALACIVAAAVFLPKFAGRLPDLRGDARYRLESSRIEAPAPPHWVPHDLAEQVVERAGLPRELSLLDNDLAQRLATAFERHPWVRGPVKVRTSIPARVQVDLQYREPVAMVRTKSGLFPIDADAVVLPARDFAPSEIAKYPAVENVSSAPRGSAGSAWGDPCVAGAARLAELLKPHWKDFGLRAIHATTKPRAELAWDDLSYQLATVGGSRIVWGRPPGSKHPGELPAEKKVERIKFYLRRHGPFDTAHGPHEFDITQWRDISRKPLTEARRSSESGRRK